MLSITKKILVPVLIASTLSTALWPIFLWGPKTAHAAQFLVDASGTGSDHGAPGAKQVWTSSKNGYLFYRNNGSGVSMSSTTDGGVTWSARRTVDSVNTADAIDVAVWWDGWTDDHQSQYIHIATIDSTDADLYYTQLDLATGAFSTTVAASSQGATLAAGVNYAAITKAHDGVLYMAATDASDSFVVSCSTTCTTGANWSERASAIDSNGNDPPLLAPVAGTANIMLVYWDVSADTVDYNVYSATSTSWWFTSSAVATAREDNTTYEQLIGITYDHVRSVIYLTFTDDTDDYITEDHDVTVWKYAGANGPWTQLTNPVTDASGGIAAAKIGVNLENGYLYCAYVRRTTIGTATTGNAYYRTSTDGGVSWSAESAAMNTTADNLFWFGIVPSGRYRFGVDWKYNTAPNAEDYYFSPVDIWYQVKRNVILFEGYKVRVEQGARLLIHQQ